jgi:hypothetical protein
MKYLLRVGEDPINPARYPSRSEAVFAVLTALITGGYTDDQIVQILRDPTYALSTKPDERGERWLRQDITRARDKYVVHPRPAVQIEGYHPSSLMIGEGRDEA